MTVIPEPATFTRKFMGYETAAVDGYIEMLTAKQKLLVDDVESLRARLQKSRDEAVALRKEVAVLTDTSPSPHAMQQRMAKMLRRAVDEVSEMQAEARAEADELIAAAQAEIEAEQRKHKELLADLTAQRKAMETEYAQAKEKLEAELASLRADAQQAREQLLAEARERADRDREEARQAVDEASRQRIKILEQLMGVYRDLEGIPGALDSAYAERDTPSESDATAELEEAVGAR